MDILGELPSELCTALSQGIVSFRSSPVSTVNSSSSSSEKQLCFSDTKNGLVWTAKAILSTAALSNSVQQIILGDSGREVPVSEVFIIEKCSWHFHQSPDHEGLHQGLDFQTSSRVDEQCSAADFGNQRSQTIEDYLGHQSTNGDGGYSGLHYFLLQNMVNLLAPYPLLREEVIRRARALVYDESPVSEQEICTCLSVIAVPSEADQSKLDLKSESYLFVDLDQFSSHSEKQKVANRALLALHSAIPDAVPKRERRKELIDQLVLYADRDIFLRASGRGIMSGLSGTADHNPRHGRKRTRHSTGDEEEDDHEVTVRTENASSNSVAGPQRCQMTRMTECPVDWDLGDLTLRIPDSPAIISADVDHIITRRVRQREAIENYSSSGASSSLRGLPTPQLTSSASYTAVLDEFRLLAEHEQHLRSIFSDHLQVLEQVQSWGGQQHRARRSLESWCSPDLVKQIDQWLSKQVATRAALESALSRLHAEINHIERDVLEYRCMYQLEK